MKPATFALLLLGLGWLIVQTACGPNAKDLGTGPASPLGAGDHLRTVQVNGMQVQYLMHIPKTITVPVSVVLAFHPALGTSESMAAVTQLSTQAEPAGWIVVYPQGYWGTWNAGNCCGLAALQKVDQVAWVRAIIADVSGLVKIESPVVFAAGFSNGAQFVYRVACELSGQIAAIAVVGSGMGAGKCRPRRAIPLIYFHGTADRVDPYRGGSGILPGVPPGQLGAVETANLWAQFDDCTNETRGAYARGAATCITRPDCHAGAEVMLCTVQGMGHQWPGGEAVLPGVLGSGSVDISATEMIIRFFKGKI